MIDSQTHQAREQLKKILSDPEFGQNGHFELQWVEGIPNRSFSIQLADDWMMYFLLSFSVLLLITFLLTYFVWYKNKKENKRMPSPPTVSTETLLEEIEGFAQNGEYRLAMQRCFHFLLKCMDENGILPFSKTKTNGEYREEVTKHYPSGAKVFQSLSLRFDEFWYGEKKVRREEYHQFKHEIWIFLGKEGPHETK